MILSREEVAFIDGIEYAVDTMMTEDISEEDMERYNKLISKRESLQYKCKLCNCTIHGEATGLDDDEFPEEDLWGHIQIAHAEVFEECQNWETPCMLEEYYIQSN